MYLNPVMHSLKIMLGKNQVSCLVEPLMTCPPISIYKLQGVVVHICSLSPLEAKAGGQPELHS